MGAERASHTPRADPAAPEQREKDGGRDAAGQVGRHSVRQPGPPRGIRPGIYGRPCRDAAATVASRLSVESLGNNRPDGSPGGRAGAISRGGPTTDP